MPLAVRDGNDNKRFAFDDEVDAVGESFHQDAADVAMDDGESAGEFAGRGERPFDSRCETVAQS
jgi:hypothetical protein